MSTPMDENHLYMDPAEMADFTGYQHFPTQHSDSKGPFDIDPRLLSAANSPTSASSPPQHFALPSNMLGNASDCDFGLYSEGASPFFDADLKFEPLRHQMLGHRRSVSVPPDDMTEDVAAPPAPPVVFHRGGHYLGDSTTNSSSGSSSSDATNRPPKRRSPRRGAPHRQSPYPAVAPKERLGARRTQTRPAFLGGPTSAPAAPFPEARYASRAATAAAAAAAAVVVPTLASLDEAAFGRPRTNADTAAMGMFGFAERIQRDVDAMKAFLARGFGGVDDDEMENIRQEKRAFNHTVTSLDEALDSLPLPAAASTDSLVSAPTTAREIRDADAHTVDTLLAAYDIPFEPEGFVFERKLALLGFLGVGRGLMHLVVD